ncbi:MAG: sterol desaturase family protein [Cyanobacteria bacterium P01_D01_bin.123]
MRRRLLAPSAAGRSPTTVWLAASGILSALVLLSIHPSFQQAPDVRLRFACLKVFEYLLFAIAFFALFWIVLDSLLVRRKLSRDRWPSLRQVLAETAFSVSSQFVFISVNLWISELVMPGLATSNRYSDLGEHSYAYYAATIFLMFFVHDTFFYWFHRLMHGPFFFRWIHKTHHESRNPTPFTTFHFHPLEAVLEAIAGKATFLVLIAMPWHMSMPIIWVLGMFVFNSIGHLGYEIYPSWWHRVPLLSMKTTALHHYMHHQRVRGNYGLYFRFWDRLCGTEFEDFEERYNILFARDLGESSPASRVPDSGRDGKVTKRAEH